jgi:hypothetical protein
MQAPGKLSQIFLRPQQALAGPLDPSEDVGRISANCLVPGPGQRRGEFGQAQFRAFMEAALEADPLLAARPDQAAPGRPDLADLGADLSPQALMRSRQPDRQGD